MLHSIKINPVSDDARLESSGIAPVSQPTNAGDLLRRPDVTLDQVVELVPSERRSVVAGLDGPQRLRLGHDMKYAAFVERETKEIARHASMEKRSIPASLDYQVVAGLRIEAMQKLSATRPMTIGQAGRMTGVTPGDVAALLVHLSKRGITECAS